jgi:RNA polymerase sigma-70 factor, ECF subfamily
LVGLMSPNRLQSDSENTSSLMQQAAAGDPRALGRLLTQHENRLLRIVTYRMDSRLRGRIDPADILQEAYLEAANRFADYVPQQNKLPFFLWLRFLTVQKLMQIHREHLDVKARDVQREISLFGGAGLQATSAVLAAQLLGKYTSPSEAAVRNELRQKLEQMLDAMEPIDREVLMLRHFEQLSNAETAGVLEIQESAASSRYVRAIRRLKQLLDAAKIDPNGSRD